MIGSLSTLIGIPLNGVGSGNMVDAAKQLSPHSQLEHRGWPPYLVGMGLSVVGAVMIVNGASEYQNANSFNENGKVTSSLGTGILFSLAGGICTYVAWYKFSASADDATRVKNTIKVGAAPLLIPEANRDGYAKGLQVSLAF